MLDDSPALAAITVVLRGSKVGAVDTDNRYDVGVYRAPTGGLNATTSAEEEYT